MSDPQHFADCTGNGSEPCWDCGGDGFYSVPTDDDPMGDEEIVCTTCEGKGSMRCPGCLAMCQPYDLDSTTIYQTSTGTNERRGRG